MSLSVGAVVGPYEITGAIGAGGMGEVYRARDVKLGRHVAIKVLPASFAAQPDRLARFQREALVLASLNHPHIATIYGLENASGHPAIAMELVEGPTLAQRIAEGTLGLDEALGLAREIAEALEAAHTRGIIHRDLKPLNIKLTHDGSVKLLDFGLAKVTERDRGPSAIAQPPTDSSPAMTALGVMLGTTAYMSPEQARGRAVDHRADVWAFGCVLYEMLTGTQAFGGGGLTDILVAIVQKDPDWSLLPAATPPGIRRLLARCLQKPVERRLHSLGDAALEIEDALAAPDETQSARASPRRWTTALPWALVVLLGAILAISLARTPREARAPLSRLAVPLPEAMIDGGRPMIALSPDGSRLAFVAQHGNTSVIYWRPVDAFQAALLPGTEGASSVLFSPDGEWIAFHAGGRLKKLSIRGGPPATLATLTDYMGAAWGADGHIIASIATHELLAVPDGGGIPRHLVPGSGDEVTRALPHLLPGGRAVLLGLARAHEPHGAVGVRELASGSEKVLVPDATSPAYVDGFLLFARAGTIFAVRFDPERLTLDGTPVPVLEGVLYNESFGTTHYAIASNGALAYVPGPASAGRTLATITRKGEVATLTDSRRAYYMPRVSPDGQRFALTILDEGAYGIWSMDLARQSLARLAAASFDPIWSPDGGRIVFSTSREGRADLAIMPSDGSSPPAPLLVDAAYKLPTSWSPDGKWIVFTRMEPGSSTGEDIFIVATDGTGVRPVIQSAVNETGGVISPDGRWLAYSSGDLNTTSVYVSSLREPARRWRVDADGGYMPRWSPDGRELFFLAATRRNRLTAVDVTVEGNALSPSKPRLVLELNMGSSIGFGLPRYDIMPDGERFVFATTEPAALTEIRMLLDWRRHLERLTTPSGR
jgi:serine/threonine protein kinase/Tol biopolymer transport system component